MTDRKLTASVLPAASALDANAWNALTPNTNGIPDNPFLCHAFFNALEESGCATAATGWQPQHILVEENDVPVGLMPLYAKSHSQGEYVFDHGWADAFQQAGGRYYPKLQSSVPFTPASAQKLLVPSGDPAVRKALLSAAMQFCSQLNMSSIHATFVAEDEASLAMEMEWLLRHDTQFHWRNNDFADFDAFLATLASRKRKAIKRERRLALESGLTIKWLSGGDLKDAHWDAFYTFYLDTSSRKWGHAYLNRAFFSMISETIGDRVVLMLAYDGETPIAGALNFLGKDRLFGRNWGTMKDVPYLHFELCYYQAIDYAIAHELGVVEAGAQGEHKLARGYAPATTRSVHWIAHPGLRDAVSDYLKQERRAVADMQSTLATHTPFRKSDTIDDSD